MMTYKKTLVIMTLLLVQHLSVMGQNEIYILFVSDNNEKVRSLAIIYLQYLDTPTDQNNAIILDKKSYLPKLAYFPENSIELLVCCEGDTVGSLEMKVPAVVRLIKKIGADSTDMLDKNYKLLLRKVIANEKLSYRNRFVLESGSYQIRPYSAQVSICECYFDHSNNNGRKVHHVGYIKKIEKVKRLSKKEKRLMQANLDSIMDWYRKNKPIE